MVTSRDVARIAGVSQTTVSRVLNGSDRVRPETRERVLAALHGYTPNAQARAMRTRRTQTIGVVASQITNPYFPELVEALYAAAKRRGLSVLLWSGSDSEMAAAEGARMGLVDGICFASATDEDGVRALIDTGIPVVLVNRGLSPALTDQVTSDSEQIGVLAARYVLDHGRRDVGVIFGPTNVGASNNRLEAFARTLDAAGVAVPEEWTARGPQTFETGYRATQQIFGDGGRIPGVIFCGNDLLAFGARSALQKLGFEVPADVWLIGVDDLPMATWEVFDLTTMRQPVADMAEHAIELLVKRIEGDDSELHEVLLDVQLIVRGSTEGATPAGRR